MHLSILKTATAFFYFLSLSSNVIGQFIFHNSLTGKFVNGVTIGGDARLTGTGNLEDDSDGEGWLRLTSDKSNQIGWAYINQPFSSDQKIIIDFEYFSWGSSTLKADGLSVFLFDGKYDVNNTGLYKFEIGGYGGALGYAQKTDVPGLTGGYLGIGLDSYGNYLIASDNKIGGISDGLKPDGIGIRGPASSGYQFIAGYCKGQSGSPLNNISIDYDIATKLRPSLNDYYRRVQIYLEPVQGLGYRITVKLKTNPTELFAVILNKCSSSLLNNPPEKLKIGFAGTTGGTSGIHEIRNLTITSVSDLSIYTQAPLAIDNQTNFSYVMEVKNDSPFDADNVTILDTLPEDYHLNEKLIASTNPANSGQINIRRSNVVEINLPVFKANSKFVFTIVGKIETADKVYNRIINTARLYPSREYPDFISVNNRSITISDVRFPDLTIVKSHKGNFIRGRTHSFLLKIANSKTATGNAVNPVEVLDVLPVGLTPVGLNYLVNGWSVSISGQEVKAVRQDTLEAGNVYPDLIVPVKVEFNTPSYLESKAIVNVLGESKVLNNTSVDTILIRSQPNTFTPNGDGINDTFEIVGFAEQDIELIVLNRWGNEVYKSLSYKNDWNGSQLSAGTYFYTFRTKSTGIENIVYSGYVTIIR